MYTMHLLIISSECNHVTQNMHNKILKNYFIRGDHSLSPSPPSLSSSHTCLRCYLSGLSVHLICIVSEWVSECMPGMRPYTNQSIFPRRPKATCARRVAEGWPDRWKGEEKGDWELGGHQGGEVMRGVAGQGATKGVAAKWGEARRVALQQGLLVSWSPSMAAFSWTASAVCFTCKTHPVERASSHEAKRTRRKAFLRLCWERKEVGLFSSLSPRHVTPRSSHGGCSNEGWKDKFRFRLLLLYIII